MATPAEMRALATTEALRSAADEIKRLREGRKKVISSLENHLKEVECRLSPDAYIKLPAWVARQYLTQLEGEEKFNRWSQRMAEKHLKTSNAFSLR